MYMYIQHRGRAPSLHDSPPTLRPQEVHIGTSYGYKTKCVATRGGLKGKSKPETMVFPSKYGVVLWIFPQTNPMISPELG